MIDARIIELLSSFGKIYIKVKSPRAGDPKSGKQAVEKGFQLSPYSADELADWDGNYGILCGDGLVVLDLDARAERDRALLSLFPETLTIRSGSGEGVHLYYRSSSINNNGVILDEDDRNVGNIQTKHKYAVGPGSGHWTGGKYEIIKDRVPTPLSAERLEQIVKDSPYKIDWANKKIAEKEADEEQNLIGHTIPIEDSVNLDELISKGDGEYQGNHPIHGSMTGQNFTVNTEKNVWYCFRCNSGGGSLSWLAVKHGLMQCHEAKPGALRGELFLKVRKLAEGLGYKIKFLPDEADDAKRFFRGKTFKPSLLGDNILTAYPTIAVGDNVFVYDRSEGTYIERGELWLRAIATRLLGESYKSGRISETVRYIMDKTLCKALPATPPEKLVVANGTLNVITGELTPHTHEEFHISSIPTEYDPDATCPTWERCLDEWIDEKDRGTFQEFCGYTLVKDYRFPVALIIFGITRSGKSTAIRAWVFVLGKGNVSTVRLQDLIDNRFAAADLFGKMMNATGELDEREVKSTATFKAITGRDPIRVERKGKDGFDMYPYAKLWYGTNELPRISSRENEAFFTRIILIRFSRQFLGENADAELDEKLNAEASGILNWALEGLHRLTARGRFERDEETIKLKESYLIQGDPFEYFWSNYVREDYRCLIETTHFNDVFAEFCRKHRVPQPSTKAVAREMRDRNVDERRKKIEGEAVRLWGGVGWDKGVVAVTPMTPYDYHISTENKIIKNNIVGSCDPKTDNHVTGALLDTMRRSAESHGEVPEPWWAQDRSKLVRGVRYWLFIPHMKFERCPVCRRPLYWCRADARAAEAQDRVHCLDCGYSEPAEWRERRGLRLD